MSQHAFRYDREYFKDNEVHFTACSYNVVRIDKDDVVLVQLLKVLERHVLDRSGDEFDVVRSLLHVLNQIDRMGFNAGHVGLYSCILLIHRNRLEVRVGRNAAAYLDKSGRFVVPTTRGKTLAPMYPK